jgi:hypothetical protein
MNNRTNIVRVDNITRPEAAGLINCLMRWSHNTQFAAQRSMKMGSSRKPRQRCGIFQPQAAAYCNRDTMVRLGYQFSHTTSARHGVALAARGEHAVAACQNNIFKRARQRGRYVEGAMKRHLHWMRKLHQLANAFDIHRTILPQQSQHHPNRTKLLYMLDILPQHFNLSLRIEKPAATWTKQHMNRKTAALDGRTHQSMARSKSSVTQAGAEFDAMRSAFFCCKAGIDCFGTKLKDRVAHVILIDPKILRSNMARSVRKKGLHRARPAESRVVDQ